MPRYMIERTFKDGLAIPSNDEGSKVCVTVVEKNGDFGVTWVHSYVSVDHKKTYCVYDGPDEAAIRKAAQRNGLPVDSVSEVSVLDPYFYH
ncbi:MAG: DUF4242 domain-containing protein [Candidatus Eremiobacteraeota bacterium]|nr:DUF4242 domain-containing protein [Candidatus Eremiobacteraeota bacterium]